MPEMKDFLNPASILTPGIAGGLTASISFPLTFQFHLPFKWVALVVSFIIGLLIVISFKEKIPKLLRTLYCVLNSLIIFSVSVGTGMTVDPIPKPPKIAGIYESKIPTSEASLSLKKIFNNIVSVQSSFATEKNKNNTVFSSKYISKPLLIAQNTKEIKQMEREALEERIRQLEEEKRKIEEQSGRERSEIELKERRLQQYNEELERYNRRWSW
jgi:hypothetical protein